MNCNPSYKKSKSPLEGVYVNLASVPEELRLLKQWVLWRLERPTNKPSQISHANKPTKVPYSVKGYRASSNKPYTWASFDQVARVLQQGRYHGVGFCLAPNDGLVGIDLDDCLDEQARPTEAAREIIKRFRHTYVEQSPSRRGLRIFCYGQPARCGKGSKEQKWIEVYDSTSPRYLTVTGWGHPLANPKIAHAQEALDWLHEMYLKKPMQSRRPKQSSQAIYLNDHCLLEKARHAANGDSFSRLFDQGDLSRYGGDHSAADLALCNHLAFWTGRDPRPNGSPFSFVRTVPQKVGSFGWYKRDVRRIDHRSRDRMV